MKEVIITATRGGLGLVVVVDGGEIKGLITDGDIRRALFNYESLNELCAASVMSSNPLTISESEMFANAENIMLEKEVTSLLVVNDKGMLRGVLKLQDSRLIR